VPAARGYADPRIGYNVVMRGVRLVLASLVLLAVSCSSSEPDDGVVATGLFPLVAHSGFNPHATFRALFSTSASSPRWSVSDPTIATVVPSGPPQKATSSMRSLSYALVTMTGVGETTVTAESGGTRLTARLLVVPYTDEDLAAGKARYETDSPDPARKPCASCHATAGGVDHSPLKMAGFDDPTILGVIQDATYPPAASGQRTTSDYSPRGPLAFVGHKWGLTDPEKRGILAHLRALPLGGL
jgi:hypothetical protein